MVKVVLYRASKYWYWYILNVNEQFHMLMTPNGHNTTIRKALVCAREYAKAHGLQIAFINVEK